MKFFRFISFLLFMSLLLPSWVGAEDDDAEDEAREVLEALYQATDGDNWTINDNWLSDEPISTWFGVRTSGNRVVDINLPNNNLTGTIPSDIGTLLDLEYLFLNGNNLSGPIPERLGDLVNLKMLSLGSNNLSGTIPGSLGNLEELDTLNLSSNNLSGRLPPQLGNLKNLTNLRINTNSGLTGPLPHSLTNLELDIFRFNFTGLCVHTYLLFEQWLMDIPMMNGTLLTCDTEEPIGTVGNMGGDDVYVVRDGVRTRMTDRTAVFEGDVIETGNQSFVQVELDDLQMTIGANSEMEVTQHWETETPGVFKSMIDFFRGELRIYLQGEGSEQDVDVRSPVAIGGIRGTDFKINYTEEGGVGRSEINVDSGRVEVTDRNTEEVTLLQPGQTIIIEGTPIYRSRIDLGSIGDAVDGWKESPWLGWYLDEHVPWVWHLDHGWWFIQENAAGGFWIHDHALDWMITTKALYPWFFILAENEWHWYQVGSSAPRWFMSGLSQEWYEVPGAGS